MIKSKHTLLKYVVWQATQKVVSGYKTLPPPRRKSIYSLLQRYLPPNNYSHIHIHNRSTMLKGQIHPQTYLYRFFPISPHLKIVRGSQHRNIPPLMIKSNVLPTHLPLTTFILSTYIYNAYKCLIAMQMFTKIPPQIQSV